jgi:hypothetical protein
MSTFVIPAKAALELKALVTAASHAQTRANDFGRACLLALGVNADDPALKLDLDTGNVTAPDPAPAPEG